MLAILPWFGYPASSKATALFEKSLTHEAVQLSVPIEWELPFVQETDIYS